jgi:peptide/nickel transport system substrate-binding protein
VKYTFDTIMNPSSDATSASYFASVASVAAPNPATVVVHMKHPDASFPAGLSTIQTGIVPSGATASALQAKPDGSGAYEFVSHVPNESITLKRNADYYAGKPGAGTLEFRVIPDDQSMVSALRTGAVDVAIFTDPVTAKTATSSSVTIEKTGSLQYHVLQLRASSPVLSNVNARLAIQCAISRTAVIDSAALGAGQVTGPITSPEYRSNSDDQPCPTQNLAQAKQYLAKAGEPNGFTLNLITSQGLNALGFVSDWLSGNFEAAIAENSGSIDPNTMYARYFTSAGTFNKVAGYSSPTLNSLFAQGIATTNTAQRQKIYQEISQQLVDNAVWVWLYTPEYYIAVNTGVHGFQARTDADLSMLWQASIS